MEKMKRIRISLPLDIVVAVYLARSREESFDMALNRFLRIGLKRELGL